MRRFALAVLAAIVGIAAFLPAAAAGAAADAPGPLSYRPPVDAPLTDRFRPPADRYGPGNRGIDYGAEPGQAVHAAAPGEVTFAGRVGPARHVVVLHADGIRTTYSFLETTAVQRGDRVEQGQPVGTTGPSGFHFGARAGDAYLDPLVLLGQRPSRAVLVDDDDREPLTEAVERRRLVDGLPRGLRDAFGRGADWARERARLAMVKKLELARALIDTSIDLHLPFPVHLALAASRWQAQQATCTPAGTPSPEPAERRIVVLVGGLGSATGAARVLDVDTGALGYAPGDVHQFNYREDGRPYGPTDTQGDLAVAGELLAKQVDDLQRRHPGVAVDLIAHSQGGLVARSAVTRHGATPALLATLASPHGGADLASAAVAVDGSRTGHRVLDALGIVRPGGIDPNSTSILQMSETSPFLRDLREHGRWPPPEVTRVVTVGARADPIVPNHQARLDPPAASVVVTPHGTATFDDHFRLPGSPEATTELGRALAGQAPTCEALDDALLDEASGRQIGFQHDLAGIGLAVTGLYLDRRASGGSAPPVPAGALPRRGEE